MFEELQKRMNHFWNDDRTLNETDPEFVDAFSRFAYQEVTGEPAANDPKLDDTNRCLAILAALIGAQGMDAFEMMLPIAYSSGVTSVQLKEVIYQATPYTGFAHSLPYLKKLNDFLNAQNVKMPLASQRTTAQDEASRIEAGEAEQVRIFGDSMKGFAQSGPEDTRHINKWLSGDCFGDYYTRGGLDTNQREMATACYLMAQGGCESQLTAHFKGNLNIGNDEHFLIAVISQCLPYIGYPRSLNAIACLRKAVAETSGEKA
ncbi:MAG: carboxymuconolactone decarboxylase family protein [Bifidobacterium sp.]|nr:carboxymuconolactone decarboxylase family protein [Bifidobacterium sp.]